MNGNIVIIAALSGELKPFVEHASARSWRRLPSNNGTKVWEYRHAKGSWFAVCAGMGAHRATAAFAEAEKFTAIDAVCSAGWAGALSPNFVPGTVSSVSQIIDMKTGERFHPALWLAEFPILVTASEVVDRREKERLVATYSASLVDMEAAAIARLALAKGIPFYCMKAVSDAMDAQLPSLNPFISAVGQLKMLPFLSHVAIRPRSWRNLAALGRHSAKAAKNLSEALYDWLDERAYVRKSVGDYT